MIEQLWNYFKTNTYSVDVSDYSILGFLFPQIKIYTSLPCFIDPSERFIYISSKPLVTDSDYLFFSSVGFNSVSNRTVLLKALTDTLTIQEKYLTTLEGLEDSDFWVSIKLLLLGLKPAGLATLDSSIYNLFTALYSDYSDIYSLYRGIGKPYGFIFHCLVTFFMKAEHLDVNNKLDISDKYLKVLNNIKPYLPEIKANVLLYIESNKTELDFLSLLASMSKERSFIC